MANLQAKPGHERFWGEFRLKRHAHQQRIRVVEAATPVIVGYGLEKLGVVWHQIGVKERTAFESIVAQSPLAEAVDGANRRFVERAQGPFKPASQPRGSWAGLRPAVAVVRPAFVPSGVASGRGRVFGAGQARRPPYY